MARNTITQLTFDAAEDREPVWTPDGRRIAFASDRAKTGVFNLYGTNADGTGEVTRLTDSPNVQRPFSWHPSGKFLSFYESRPAMSADLMMLPMEGDATRGWKPGTPTVFLSTPAAEVAPMFSPDGRFVAYFSTEAGGSDYDVYVRPFPGPGGKWRISTTSGIYPQWSATTHELLFLNYRDPTPSKIMAAPYAIIGDSFQVETPKVWSPTCVQNATPVNRAYDLHPYGKRIAAAAVVDQDNIAQDKVVFIFNFAEHLAKIAEGGLAFLHPETRAFLRGAVVAASYPLFSATQLTTRPRIPQHQFQGVGPTGIYNALLTLLDEEQALTAGTLLDYETRDCDSDPPGAGEASKDYRCGPGVWISVIGHNAGWPMRRYGLTAENGGEGHTETLPGEKALQRLVGVHERIDADVQIAGNAAPGAVATGSPLVGELLAAGATGVEPKQAWTNVAD